MATTNDWHFGKIILLWVIDLFVLLFLYLLYNYNFDKAAPMLLWFILSIPAIMITWKWLTSREKKIGN
jgi:hypothetical protein